MTKFPQRNKGRGGLTSSDFKSYQDCLMFVINSLSVFCQVEIKRDGYLWQQTFAQGLVSSNLEQIRPLETHEKTGTSISFRPDFSILEENEFDFELIAERCKELAYLLPQLRFTIFDKREKEQTISYHYPHGLLDWLKDESKGEKGLFEPLSISYDCELRDKGDRAYQVRVELAFQWLEDDKSRIASFVNTMIENGYQSECLQTSLEKHLGKKWMKLKQGFIGIINILHPDPQFESQTNHRLINFDIPTALDAAVEAIFAAHPEAKAAIRAYFAK